MPAVPAEPDEPRVDHTARLVVFLVIFPSSVAAVARLLRRCLWFVESGRQEEEATVIDLDAEVTDSPSPDPDDIWTGVL